MGNLLQAQAATLPPSPSWDEVAGLCEHLCALSAQVGQSLEEGAGAGALVPLLRRELELARRLQEDLARIGQQPGAQAGARSLELSVRLRDLLARERANQSLLQRRGLRLRGPRSPFSRPDRR